MHKSEASTATARLRLTPDNLAERVAGLGQGERLAVIGLTRDGVGEVLAARDIGRAVLLTAAEGLRTARAVIDRLLDDLADLALARWPDWPGRDGQAPDVSGPWLKAAATVAAAGRPPRFRRVAPALEFAQLLRAVDPGSVILVAEVDPVVPARARAAIEALEWCAGQGASCILALPAEPPDTPPYDRILYGACTVGRAAAPAAERFIAPRSRAHPASDAEKRIEAALAKDPELAGLFTGNETVQVAGPGRQPRVDLLCSRHRIVVEIDGPEHQASPKFAQDRHRDFELLVAGYLVLRLTNDQVADDLQFAVEKIRAVVRLRRSLPSPGDIPR
ncbi:endonuclease domain-containing protein [Methylobacterium sp. Gmos1]